MPVKKKPTAKQLAARKKFVEMVRAKAKAKKIASTHKDTKSHNVNIRVVSGSIGALPFTGKFLGVNIKATKEPSGIRLDIGNTRMGINRNTNTFNATADFINTVEKQSGRKLSVSEIEKGMKVAKSFIVSLKKEAPSISKKVTTISKPAIKTKQNREYYKDSNINKSVRQTGTSDKLRDKSRVAKDPGKRETEWGSVYYERRANRSDKPGSLLGIKGLKKISGVLPHKAKYYIDYMLHGIERTEYFDKLPKGKYRAENNIYYILKLTDAGTSLIPILNVKTNQPIKKVK